MSTLRGWIAAFLFDRATRDGSMEGSLSLHTGFSRQQMAVPMGQMDGALLEQISGLASRRVEVEATLSRHGLHSVREVYPCEPTAAEASTLMAHALSAWSPAQKQAWTERLAAHLRADRPLHLAAWLALIELRMGGA